MKFKKVITMGVAAIMAVSAMSISAFAESNGDEIVYSYIDENNNEVNLTQTDLDAEHWDKDALGDTAPFIYEDFPMSITEYSNDVAELYLDLVYMKKLEDMDSVHLEILRASDGNAIYNNDLTQSSFYSPQMTVNETYKVTLTETINGEMKKYERIVETYEAEAEMPEYVKNADVDDESIIMIADVENLRLGRTVEGNNISVDMSASRYEHIKANEFKEYCANLPHNKTYRVYTISNNEIYSGYIDTNNVNKIYNLQINSCSLEDFYSTAVASVPTYTLSEVKSKAQDARYTEYCCTLKESKNEYKYQVYSISMPDEFIDANNPPVFQAVARSNSAVTMKVWYTIGNSSSATLHSAGVGKKTSNNTTVFRMEPTNFTDSNKSNYVTFYVMVYLTSSVNDTVSVSFEDVSNYNDDVTGSIYNAYYGESSYTELPNTEFSLTDSWDVDVFYIDYQGTNDKTYKIELKNRSIEEQNKLESGTGDKINGSHAKYLVLRDFWDEENLIISDDFAVYEVPKNADLSIYNQIKKYNTNIIAVYDQKLTTAKGEKYQLSFKRYPN